MARCYEALARPHLRVGGQCVQEIAVIALSLLMFALLS